MLGPASQVTRESSTLKLSASKSKASVPCAGRAHPSAPLPLVMSPGCWMRNESRSMRPSAKRTLAAPVSMIVPAKNDGASVAVRAPAGFVTLSAVTVPVATKLSRDGGAPLRTSQRCRFRSCVRSVNRRAP